MLQDAVAAAHAGKRLCEEYGGRCPSYAEWLARQERQRQLELPRQQEQTLTQQAQLLLRKMQEQITVDQQQQLQQQAAQLQQQVYPFAGRELQRAVPRNLCTCLEAWRASHTSCTSQDSGKTGVSQAAAGGTAGAVAAARAQG